MKNTKIYSITFLLLFVASFGFAQSLGEFKPKSKAGGKLKSKEVYIANFSVNYQVYNQKDASTGGGFTGKMLTGKTKATLAVGLNNITTEDLQQLTNELYQDFINDLKQKGFTILEGDAAANTKYYEDYERYENLEMSLSEAPGLVTVYPENRVFFVKGFTKSGEKKQGGFFGAVNRVQGGNAIAERTHEVMSYSKLSSELNDANVVNVDLCVLFLNDEKAYQGRGAKISVSTNMHLPAIENYSFTEKTTGAMTLLKSKKRKAVACVNAIDFVQGKNKIGGSPLGQYSGTLKKELPIEGVIGKEKIQSFAKADVDKYGLETVYGKAYRVENESIDNSAFINVDRAKYIAGAKQALSKFLSYHTSEFASEIK